MKKKKKIQVKLTKQPFHGEKRQRGFDHQRAPGHLSNCKKHQPRKWGGDSEKEGGQYYKSGNTKKKSRP